MHIIRYSQRTTQRVLFKHLMLRSMEAELVRKIVELMWHPMIRQQTLEWKRDQPIPHIIEYHPDVVASKHSRKSLQWCFVMARNVIKKNYRIVEDPHGYHLKY